MDTQCALFFKMAAQVIQQGELGEKSVFKIIGTELCRFGKILRPQGFCQCCKFIFRLSLRRHALQMTVSPRRTHGEVGEDQQHRRNSKLTCVLKFFPDTTGGGIRRSQEKGNVRTDGTGDIFQRFLRDAREFFIEEFEQCSGI